ncbi:hypothetical protein [Desulfosoma caldarium]|uniref:hypothetical protein n=1 Tax=Desulfosoma caldarium TaxID=610254 RepID=UPI0011CD82BC|nr:hypothetical protein [Desulfosoma caldarium]
MAEKLYARRPQRAEEAFDGEGAQHAFGLSLGDGALAGVHGQGVEGGAVPVGAVEEKAQELCDLWGDRLPLAASTHEAEKDIDVRANLDGAKIAHKQTQTAAARECIVGHVNAVNRCFAFCRG